MEKPAKYFREQPKLTLMEWRVCEHDQDWESTLGAQIDSLSNKVELPRWNHPKTLHLGLAGVLLIFVLTLPVAWWFWVQAQLGVAQIDSELHAAVDADLWREVNVPPTLSSVGGTSNVNNLLMNSTHDGQEQVTKMELRVLGKEWAVVRLNLRLHDGGPTYRQTRVYRSNERGWQRSDVTTALWGEARQYESAHFVFHYRSLDQEAVVEAAPQIETRYASLYRTLFGVEPPDELVVIVVDPEKSVALHTIQVPAADIITIASPSAMLARADIPEGELLDQSVMLELLINLSQEASTHYAVPSQWKPLGEGLRLWLLWQQELPLANWRVPVVRQTFSQTPEEGMPTSSSFSEFSDFAYSLCASHALWITTPLEIGIPLICFPPGNNHTATNDSNILSWRIAASQVENIDLPPITTPSPRDRSVALADSTTKVVIMASIVDYIAATYGSQRLPALLASLSQYDSWESLIPALFGISQAEFEEGWHQFLATEYGVLE